MKPHHQDESTAQALWWQGVARALQDLRHSGEDAPTVCLWVADPDPVTPTSAVHAIRLCVSTLDEAVDLSESCGPGHLYILRDENEWLVPRTDH